MLNRTPNAAMLMKSHVYWYVQLQGPDFLIPLVVQRASKEEALAFAERIGEATGLPVEATNQEP